MGGGRQRDTIDIPEYQHQNLSHQSMELVRVGTRLAKAINLTILVTGGVPDETCVEDLSEDQIMKKVLELELEISAKCLEEQSNITQKNASESAKILKKESIKIIYLFTHFGHMPRAQRQFKKVWH